MTIKECVQVMRETMISVSRGETALPIRQFLSIPGTQGKMAMMPGAISSPGCHGIKLVCKYPREESSVYGSHVGMVVVFDSENGLPLAMIEGSSLTSIRTAAASALATDLMARKKIKALSILGCGEQAKRHILSIITVRNPDQIYVWGRDYNKASEFSKNMSLKIGRPVAAVQTAEEVVSMADLICTTTSSPEPVLKGDWLKPGSHVNLVGAAVPSSSEADEKVVTRSRFIVDYRPAAMAAAGELLGAIKNGVASEENIVGEIGEVADGKILGRKDENEITVYKSLGVSAQDLAVANWLYEKSIKLGFGLEVNMMDDL